MAKCNRDDSLLLQAMIWNLAKVPLKYQICMITITKG